MLSFSSSNGAAGERDVADLFLFFFFFFYFIFSFRVFRGEDTVASVGAVQCSVRAELIRPQL
jgi:hypothetical protein